MCGVCRTQHCGTLSTTEAKYVAMAEEVKEGLFVRSVLFLLQPGVGSPLNRLSVTRGALQGQTPLSFVKRKCIDMW